MVKKRKKILVFVFCTFSMVLLFITNSLMAQPLPDNPDCWPPPCLPIDGGIGFLIAAGIAFGVKKTLGYRSQKSE